MSYFRRTDYIQYSAEKYGLKPFKKSFFRDAMDYFREEFDNVVFLWISDDMDWGRKHFKKYKDIFFVGNGNEVTDAIGYDLALLAQSNHNIIHVESVSSCRYLLLAPTWARITDTDDTRPGCDMPFATPTAPAAPLPTDGRTTGLRAKATATHCDFSCSC